MGQDLQNGPKSGLKTGPLARSGPWVDSEEVLGRFWTYFGTFDQFRGSPVYLTGYGQIWVLGQAWSGGRVAWAGQWVDLVWVVRSGWPSPTGLAQRWCPRRWVLAKMGVRAKDIHLAILGGPEEANMSPG